MSDEMVSITREEYEELLERSAWLDALETAGVDNWPGIEIAHDLFEESK